MLDITQIFRAIAEVFGWVNRKSDLKNAPDVKAAKVAQQQVNQHEANVKAVAEGNLEEVRRRASE
jgi:hypothetical protein